LNLAFGAVFILEAIAYLAGPSSSLWHFMFNA
jgi:uncharacterized protein YjeT (DUF2065 family)